MIDHETPCRQFLQPGEVLLHSEDYGVYPNLPLVPAHMRVPAKKSALEKRIWGALDKVIGKASRPIDAVSDNRFTNHRMTRAAGNVAEGLSEAQENFEDAVDDAVEHVMYGKPMEGGWTSMAGRYHVQVTNAGGNPGTRRSPTAGCSCSPTSPPAGGLATPSWNSPSKYHAPTSPDSAPSRARPSPRSLRPGLRGRVLDRAVLLVPEGHGVAGQRVLRETVTGRRPITGSCTCPRSRRLTPR
ncbi:hypothetical protein [Streptomyces sp. MST-110588]|uniref:hypothetical protein n=1 Tax=Streptomyces sp. MST-110588 TaxID=2833628 RepID=UPI001F5C0D6B|nr:hypothetical protein [Streptomyces sp. MST-110588]UNO38723.1 hypothetical protein KGS77_02490 [Streptomyces sp. MST-110588]